MDLNSILLGPRPDNDFFGGMDLPELANASKSGKIATFIGIANRESIIFSWFYLLHFIQNCEILKT